MAKKKATRPVSGAAAAATTNAASAAPTASASNPEAAKKDAPKEKVKTPAAAASSTSATSSGAAATKTAQPTASLFSPPSATAASTRPLSLQTTNKSLFSETSVKSPSRAPSPTPTTASNGTKAFPDAPPPPPPPPPPNPTFPSFGGGGSTKNSSLGAFSIRPPQPPSPGQYTIIEQNFRKATFTSAPQDSGSVAAHQPILTSTTQGQRRAIYFQPADSLDPGAHCELRNDTENVAKADDYFTDDHRGPSSYSTSTPSRGSHMPQVSIFGPPSSGTGWHWSNIPGSVGARWVNIEEEKQWKAAAKVAEAEAKAQRKLEKAERKAAEKARKEQLREQLRAVKGVQNRQSQQAFAHRLAEFMESRNRMRTTYSMHTAREGPYMTPSQEAAMHEEEARRLEEEANRAEMEAAHAAGAAPSEV